VGGIHFISLEKPFDWVANLIGTASILLGDPARNQILDRSNKCHQAYLERAMHAIGCATEANFGLSVMPLRRTGIEQILSIAEEQAP
jgi:hypothetical protein